MTFDPVMSQRPLKALLQKTPAFSPPRGPFVPLGVIPGRNMQHKMETGWPVQLFKKCSTFYGRFLRTFAPKNFSRTDFFKTLTDGRK